MSEIDKDLVRWKRGKWLCVIAIFFALQMAAIVLSSQKRVASREIYPQEPAIAMSEFAKADWDELENPFLFAGASWNGFSADAWLRKPEWQAPETGFRVAMRLLSFAELPQEGPVIGGKEPFPLVQRQRSGAILPGPREVPRQERKSELQLEGLNGRRLLKETVLPPQIHNDVLSRTVVEALVSPDGMVISAHILENSGSAKADADAMALTRKTWFSPKGGTNQEPELGKLIFQWHALDLNSVTNDLNNRSNNVVR
jgi:hypothetical protein